jgi:hypothetical protein
MVITSFRSTFLFLSLLPKCIPPHSTSFLINFNKIIQILSDSRNLSHIYGQYCYTKPFIHSVIQSTTIELSLEKHPSYCSSKSFIHSQGQNIQEFSKFKSLGSYHISILSSSISLGICLLPQTELNHQASVFTYCFTMSRLCMIPLMRITPSFLGRPSPYESGRRRRWL